MRADTLRGTGLAAAHLQCLPGQLVTHRSLAIRAPSICPPLRRLQACPRRQICLTHAFSLLYALALPF
jgi:hypothetical protein